MSIRKKTQSIHLTGMYANSAKGIYEIASRQIIGYCLILLCIRGCMGSTVQLRY